MKSKRLDIANWYDHVKDVIICIFCEKSLQRIEQHHLKTHGFESIAEYKQEYGILPKTPLKNKRLLNADKERMCGLREQKIVKLFRKGETSIPIRYQKSSTKGFDPSNKEFRKLVSVGTKGIPKTEKFKKRASECRKGIYPEHLKRFSFKKGQRAYNRLYENYTQCAASGCIRKPMARMLCGLHYQRIKKGGDLRNNQAKIGVML